MGKVRIPTPSTWESLYLGESPPEQPLVSLRGGREVMGVDGPRTSLGYFLLGPDGMCFKARMTSHLLSLLKI